MNIDAFCFFYYGSQFSFCGIGVDPWHSPRALIVTKTPRLTQWTRRDDPETVKVIQNDAELVQFHQDYHTVTVTYSIGISTVLCFTMLSCWLSTYRYVFRDSASRRVTNMARWGSNLTWKVHFHTYITSEILKCVNIMEKSDRKLKLSEVPYAYRKPDSAWEWYMRYQTEGRITHDVCEKRKMLSYLTFCHALHDEAWLPISNRPFVMRSHVF